MSHGLQIKNKFDEILIDSEKSCLILHQTYKIDTNSTSSPPYDITFTLGKTFTKRPIIGVTPVNCAAVAHTESIYTAGVGYTKVRVKFLLYSHNSDDSNRFINIYVLGQGNDNSDKIEDYGLITYDSNNELSFVSNGEQLQYVNRYSASLDQHSMRDVTINRNFTKPPVIIPINWYPKTGGNVYMEENYCDPLAEPIYYYSLTYNLYSIRYNNGLYNTIRFICYEGEYHWYDATINEQLTVDIYSLSE